MQVKKMIVGFCLGIMGLVMTSPVFAATELVTCWLNRSVMLKFYEVKGDEGVTVVVKSKHFLQPDEVLLAEIVHPQVIQYGGQRLYLLDRGRSGYFFLKLESSNPPSQEVTVYLDSNMFLNTTSANTNGTMQKYLCQQL